MDHEPLKGARDVATTNKMNVLLGMKNGVERKTTRRQPSGMSGNLQGKSYRRGAFELSCEGQAGVNMVEKKSRYSKEGKKAYAKALSHGRQVQEIPGSSFSLELELEL